MEAPEKIHVADATFTDKDKRVKNEIISFLKEGTPYYCPNSVRRQEWIAWLEKHCNG